MSAHPQLAASPDDIDYWTHSDWWPVWLVLERWGWPEPQCLEAKRQALLSACERGQVQWRRSDGKPYDDPIHELAARNIRGQSTVSLQTLSFSRGVGVFSFFRSANELRIDHE